jgi:hypothetical protein
MENITGKKSQTRLILFVLALLFVGGIVFALQAFPGGSTHLAAQSCLAYNTSGQVSCQGTYPGVCGAAGDRVGCSDGINESITNPVGTNGQIIAFNITYFNSSVNTCQSIDVVFLCYRRSVPTSGAIGNCNISVDNNNWASPRQVNATCPPVNTLQPLICANVTNLEAWNCSNFFGSSGSRAVARVQIAPSTGSGTRTLNVDAFFFNVTYSADTIPPTINFTSPSETSGSYVNRAWALVNVTASDSNFKNLSIYLFNSTRALVNSSNTTLTSLYSNFSGLGNGIYYFNVTAYDLAGNLNSTETRNVTIDLINPNINFSSSSETSGSYQIRRNIQINISINDTNFKNATIFLFNSSGSLVNFTNTSLGNSLFVNFTNLVDGVWFFNATAYDLAGNLNSTETRNITIDNVNPTINFTSPSETSGSYVNRAWALVNVTASDSNFKNLSIYLFNSTRALVNSSNTTLTSLYSNFSGLGNGIYYFNATAYDLAGNLNSTETRNVTIDLINPGINFTSPTLGNGSIVNLKNFVVNISINDTNYANVTLNLFNSSLSNINSSFSNLNNLYLNFTNLSHGWYYFNATAYDLAGNFNSTETRAIFVNRTVILGSITALPSPIAGGRTITINASGVIHSNNESLNFYCSNSSQSPSVSDNICSSSSSYPYSLSCGFVVPLIGGTYNVFCRVSDTNHEVFSLTKNTTYLVSSTVPSTSVVSVAGKTNAPYYDTNNDGATLIIVQGDINLSCKWDSSDLAFSSMSSNCINYGNRSNCSINNALIEGAFNRYISCADNATGLNEQNASNNLDIQFYLDYTTPTTSDNSDSNFKVPNYLVTITELDNVDSNPLTYYCSSTSVGCSPTTIIDNGGIITYTASNRGVNYLRYYSIDFAGNNQSIVNKTININQLPVLTSASDNAVTIKGGTPVNVSSVSYDLDAGQTLVLRVCDSIGANYSACSGTQYCSSSGIANLSCVFNSEIDSGVHNWYAYIFDSLNESASGNPQTGSYTTDSTGPTLTPASPTNSTYTQTTIIANVVLGESVGNVWYNLDGNLTNVSMTNTSAVIWVATISNLSLGSHNIIFYANDSFGNLGNSSFIYFSIENPADITAPTITIVSPSDATYVSTAPFVNVTSDESLNWAGYRLNGGSLISMSNLSLTNWFTTLSLSQESINTLVIYANDTSNNQANKTITIYGDSLAPRYSNANVVPNPSNQSQSVNCSISWNDGFNISNVIIEENSLGFYENHTFASFGSSGDVSYLISGVKLSNNGVYTCRFYASDASGNTNLTSQIFTVNDVNAPSIIITSPTNATYNQQNITVSLVASENASSAWYSLNGTGNVSMINSSGINWNATLTNLVNGAYNIIFYANDSSGNIGNSSLVYFSVNIGSGDSVPPVISINTLTNASYYNLNNLELNITSNENLSWAGYNLNGGSLISMSNNSLLNWNATLVSLPEGMNNLTIYANDTSNNQVNVNLSFYIDSVLPDFISSSVYPNPANESQSVTCSVYINDSSPLTSVKISENALAPGIYINHTIDLNSSGWANYTIFNLKKGSYNCYFYATDAAGNYDYTSIGFSVNDVVSPLITINSPLNQTYYSSSILLSITANENLSSAYYSLDGAANISLTGSAASWSKTISVSDGSHNIIFYANDSSGNLGNSSSVYFYVDTTIYDTNKPIITIWSPTNNTYYTSANVLLNITSDKALSWAGYRLNGGSLTALGNVSTTNWNLTISGLGEGTYNITFFGNDTTTNKNQGNTSSIFYVDLNNPSVDSFSCNNPVNNSQNVNCSASVSDSLRLDYTIISNNATGVWTNSSHLTLVGTNTSTSSIILASDTTMPVFTSIIYLYDTAGKMVSGEFNVSVIDDSYPAIYNISYAPNTTDALDPGVRINVSVDVVEDYSLASVLLMYKESADVSWSSLTMSNTTSINYNASFIPTNGTWSFKINATDSAGNQNISGITTLVITNDTSIFNSTTIPSIKSFTPSQASDTNNLGELVLTNTGDILLNINISVQADNSIRDKFNINLTGSSSFNYSLISGGSITLGIYVNTTSLPQNLYAYNLSVNSEAGTILLNKQLNIQQSGPYFQLSIDKSSSSVTQGDSGIIFESNVINLGTQDANNVSLVWTLPSGFSIGTGDSLNRSINFLLLGSTLSNSISVSVGSSMTVGCYNVVAEVIYNSISNKNLSKEVCVSGISSGSVSVVSGGGGGSGGSGGVAKSISYAKIIEIVRGKEDSFDIVVENKFANSTLEDLTLEVSGFLSQYIEISPLKISKLTSGQKEKFIVKLKIPSYKENYEEQILKAVVNGYINSGGSSRTGYTENYNIKLIIEEISHDEANNSLEEAEKAIAEMKSLNMNTQEVIQLLEQARVKLSDRRNKDSQILSDKIISIKETAFKTDELLRRVITVLNNPKKAGLLTGSLISLESFDRTIPLRDLLNAPKKNTTFLEKTNLTSGKSSITGFVTNIYVEEAVNRRYSEIKDIILLSIAAFERGDYITSEERAKNAQSILLLELKGNFILFLYMYWQFIMLALIILSIILIIGYNRYRRSSINRNIEDINEEEKNIAKMIQESQAKYFKGEISVGEYHSAMAQNQDKLARIKKQRLTLRNKRINILRPEEINKELQVESKEVEADIVSLQEKFYRDNKISENEYKTQFEIDNERLAEIEGERTTLEIIKSGKIDELRHRPKIIASGGEKKDNSDKSGFFSTIINYFKNRKHKRLLREEIIIKKKIREMGII